MANERTSTTAGRARPRPTPAPPVPSSIVQSAPTRATTRTSPAATLSAISRHRLALLLLPVAALIVALIVGNQQVGDRAPLVWDESFRVSQGAYVSYMARDGEWGLVWDWFNAQTFYPFLLPTIHGVVYYFTENPLLAGWLPGLLGYVLAGLLAARLAVVLGAGALGAWLAALLTWLIPMLARLGGGAFTEPLGACLLLTVAILLAQLGRRQDTEPVDTDVATTSETRGGVRRLVGLPALRDAILLAVAIALAFFLKYDYGLLAAGTVGLTAIIALITTRRPRAIAVYLLTALVLIVPVALWLALDFSRKWDGLRTFVGQAIPSRGGNPDPLYYPLILFGGRDVESTVWLGPSLAPAIALLFIGGVVWAVIQARRQAAIRGAAIMVVLWYIAYSAANWQDPRYLATILPTMATLAAVALVAGITWLRSAPRSRPVWIGAAVLGLILVVQLTQQSVGADGVGTQATFLRPNKPAEAAVDFVADTIAADPNPVVLIGHSNEISQHALVTARSQRLGHAANTIVPAPERTSSTPNPPSPDVLLGLMGQLGARLVVGFDISPDSRLYSEDFQARWPSQPRYIGFAKQLEADGTLSRVAEQSFEDGKFSVTIWQLTTEIFGTTPSFRGQVPGVAQAVFALDPPIVVRWSAEVDPATGTFETTAPVLLPAGNYTLSVDSEEVTAFTVAAGERKVFRGQADDGATVVRLRIDPKIRVSWVVPVDGQTGNYTTEVPGTLASGRYRLLINGQVVKEFVVVDPGVRVRRDTAETP